MQTSLKIFSIVNIPRKKNEEIDLLVNGLNNYQRFGKKARGANSNARTTHHSQKYSNLNA
jgi:hypothetical protein